MTLTVPFLALTEVEFTGIIVVITTPHDEQDGAVLVPGQVPDVGQPPETGAVTVFVKLEQ